MKGMPKVLNTKHDVLLCHSLALEGKLSKDELRQKLLNMLSDEKVWVYKEEVSENYAPKENEKVMEQVDFETGTTKHICYELQENPNARYLQMGFSKEELLNLINQLEV
ncbi:hypothetical protein [Thermodesulfovibrio sp.]|uniref:hypothetical protein n=1 Tax=Thermodesulfovibrio sp. TaxID=2067987 RepID=UPI0030AFBBF5